VLSPIQFIVTWAHRRRALVLSGALIVVLLSGLGLRRLSFDPDVLSLLPRDGEAIPAFRTFLQRFGSLDQLFVVFTAPEGRAVAEYSTDVDRWVAQLRAAPEIEWVDAGTAGPDRDWAWLAERQLLLLPRPALETALSRLEPDGMATALASTRELLTMPSAAVTAMVSQDPLDLLGLLRRQLGGQRAGITIGIAEGGYVSADGRHRLVIAKPRQPPFDTRFSRLLQQRLDTIGAAERSAVRTEDDEPKPPIEVAFAGGHRIALETETVVKREAVMNTVGSLALILPLLFIAFRSVWLLFCGALPSVASLLVALGLLGLGGATLSAAATGAAAMLFGLGMDGVVLIYVAHRLALARGLTAADSVATLGGPSASMLLGMLTTAATFYGLVFVDFPSLQQLGLVIGHSMVACGLLTLVLVPALLPRRRPSGPIRILIWPSLASWIVTHRTRVLAVSAVATLVLGAAALRLNVDTSLERLRSTTPAARFEESVRERFGLPTDVYVWLQHGPVLDPLLAANEALLARARNEAPGLTIDGPSTLLPSSDAQARSLALIRERAQRPELAQAALIRAATEAGFRSGTLDPFLHRLPRLVNPERLTYDSYKGHGLGDVIGRFISHAPDGWTLATYAFPSNADQARALERITAADAGSGRLTGLALVNRELAAQFVPQFLRGLSIGSLVVVLMIAFTFRAWRLSILAMVPTAAGLVWAAGLLALGQVPLDLFALFAVVTFVGIGIDYGIHLVHRFRDHENAEVAVAELAPVIVVAGLITLAGYGTLVTSSYPPLRSIGVVSVVSVFTLVAASVLLLPALLVGRRATR
jgi:predicted RND superfamily exporter protein